MTGRNRRSIDHCVLPVADLEDARIRLGALGFTVAPQGKHPFGTANACVYFENDTFIEPLAVVDPEVAKRSALKHNVFVSRDAAYRFRNGKEGFSALALATSNAKADHRRFVINGISAGRRLEFSREFKVANRKVGTASFRLAFAADPRSPDAFFFTCERVSGSKIDRTPLQKHANGALAISRVVMSEPSPSDFQYFVQMLSRSRQARFIAGSMEIETANACLQVLNRRGMIEAFGVDTGEERGLKLQAIIIQVSDLDGLERLLSTNAVGYERRLGRVIVQRSKGQGAIFAFEAAK